MLAVVADTHGTEDARLASRVADVIADAEKVLHTGDFTTAAVYDAFDRRARELIAVHGNSDEDALRERLPAVRTIEWEGWSLLLVHGHEHTATSLPLLARERGADLVIAGHTHRPAIERLGGLRVVNPGSHADPRAGPPSHAELRTENGVLRVEIRDRAGDVIERERVSGE
ncbi:phosphodiesterase family protein [Halorhabdus tiamatea SARL4B]|uniref:Phosphoesterase n=1 Tax=Halorhabdus tiamatea SARL4B TaxID=1033806 RepID=S6CTW6_9EURY|nr:metallophosphoesterase [Halorhabdus tiamatea]ERJ05727.1 phosphodiesterase family protein [Halorhabdus tiamatea SARL4B]CCQ33949.1 phosphodiesterase, MJ0936 family protein [Halorhabdus tiamatea SARL4B]